jgi:hypothetical protein
MVRIKSLLNILSTIVAILALAPVIPYLGTGIIVAACVGVVAGAWCDRREHYPLHGVAATVVSIIAIGFYALQVSWVDVATPVTQALIALLIIRLLTPKESRDYLQIFVLGLFVLAGSSLVSLDLGLGFGFLTYLVLLIFAVTLGLVVLTVYETDKRMAMPRQDLYKLIRVSLIMPVVALALMVVFFFVLPRTRHPMWNFLNPGNSAKSGLAESVEPGSYARISSNSDLAFRAEMEELAPEDLYWRAMVLNRPDGQSWIRVAPPREKARPVNSSRTVETKIFADSSNDQYLFTLDYPTMLSGLKYRSHDDSVFMASRRLDRPYQLQMLSHIGAELAVTGSIDEAFYLALPPRISTRMKQLAAGITDEAASREERISRLANFFRAQQLVYAQDELPSGADAIDAFLFDKKRGYCEFFASAYITLARLSGIPSRLVGGYLGGEFNPFGDYYLVKEDAAHVWVEVLTDNNHWVRIDPSQWAINAETALHERSAAKLSASQQLIDNLNYQWTQGVLLFDFYRQLDFFRETRSTFRKLRSPDVELRHLLWVGPVLICFAIGYVLINRKKLSPESRFVEELRMRLRRRYGDDAVSPARGLEELGERLDNDAARQFAKIYQGAVFRDRALNTAERKRLKELLREI